jgi:hypothetical protein
MVSSAELVDVFAELLLLALLQAAAPSASTQIAAAVAPVLLSRLTVSFTP